MCSVHGPCCQEDASHSFEAETGQARRLRSVSTSIFDRPPVMSFKKKPSISTSSPVRSSGQFALFLSPGLSLSQSADRTAHSSIPLCFPQTVASSARPSPRAMASRPTLPRRCFLRAPSQPSTRPISRSLGCVDEARVKPSPLPPNSSLLRNVKLTSSPVASQPLSSYRSSTCPLPPSG